MQTRMLSGSPLLGSLPSYLERVWHPLRKCPVHCTLKTGLVLIGRLLSSNVHRVVSPQHGLCSRRKQPSSLIEHAGSKTIQQPGSRLRASLCFSSSVLLLPSFVECFSDVEAMHRWSNAQHQQGRTVALVPTMGALHKGHLALVEEAQQHADAVVVSIFVNPTQFAPDEDFEAYPRTLDADRKALSDYDGVEAIFAPTVEAMYPFGASTTQEPYISVDVHTLNNHLCGKYRPGHFEGVVTVVSKLFNACKPDVAVFGQKDAQQLVILKHLVQALRFDIDVVGVPTVRESDGLACSSRNAYLNKAERAEAPRVYEAIQAGVEAVERGEQQVKAVVRAMRNPLSTAKNARIQYTSVVDAETLQPKTQLHPGDDVLLAAAVFFGDTRLIDNAFVQVPSSL